MSNYHHQASRKSTRTGKSRKYSNYLARSLALLGLIAGGSPLGLLPVFAAPTASNVTIDNQATGTFVDLDDTSTGTQLVVSNTVSVTVAEVAGITIVSSNIPSAFVGSVADFDFKIKNIGNDPTKFFLPSTLAASKIVGGTQSGVLQVVGYVPAGSTTVATLTTPIDVTTAGDTNSFGGGTLGGNTTLGSIPADAAIIVRVKVTVTATVGNPVSVVLGDTPAVGDSNISYTAGTNDVYTVDHPVGSTVAGEATGIPVNGEREASATQSVNAILSGSDYGDAPDTYKTLATSGGPSHTLSSLYLGAGVTADSDGQPNATATSDINDDGVTFSPSYGGNYSNLIQEGVSNTVTVVSSGAGFVNAWIDYNHNGIFNAGEIVFTNQAVVAGSNTLTFTPPANLLHGPTFARFRVSPTSIATPSPVGAITGGEVEDYQVTVATPIPDGAACSATGLLNGSFETPALAPGTFSKPQKSLVLGWNTTATDQAIEIWSNGFAGIPSYSGNQFAEMNANQVASMYQDIATVPGTTLTYQFAHRARRAINNVVVDTATVSTGTPGGSLTQLRTFSTDSTDWVVYQGTYLIPANQYITRFQFNSISGGAGLPTFGNFIDAVQFSVDTCVTPISPPTIDLDGNDSTATGNDYQNTFTAGGVPVAAADTDVAITDEKTNITRATIQLTNPLDGVTESLTFDTVLAASLGITVDTPYDSSTVSPGNGQPNSTLGRLTLKGTATKAQYQQVLATLKYSNTKASPTMTPRTINVQVIDSDKMISNTAVATIKMLAKPNVLLVKRITAINGVPKKRNSDPLDSYEDTSSPYDDNNITIPTQPTTSDPQRDTAYWPTPNTFLLGAIDGGDVKPLDSIEYTIYFLSTGDSEAKNVLFCDRVPANTTFIPNSFNSVAADPLGLSTADRGIVIHRNGTPNSYTNIGDEDIARYYPPNEPLPNGCKTTITDPNLNPNGTVVVNFGTIPNAITAGSPNTSYGFVRFRGQVK
jgi:uncharacterized repeat protein (TIGR01451 family)